MFAGIVAGVVLSLIYLMITTPSIRTICSTQNPLIGFTVGALVVVVAYIVLTFHKEDSRTLHIGQILVGVFLGVLVTLANGWVLSCMR